MNLAKGKGTVLVTGAAGHIGSELCRLLTSGNRHIVAIDLHDNSTQNIRACDLRSESQVSSVFENHAFNALIHLAGMLPSAFQCEPLTGADVNLTGTLRLIRHAIRAGVTRFVFASSMSVYGSNTSQRALSEDDSAAPDEVYGAAKRAIEVVGENLSKSGAIQFIALRIARVVGPGIRKTSSPWRSQIFEASPKSEPIRIPFSPDAMLSLVYVEDVARMLLMLLEAAHVNHCIYNTPVEIWQAKQLKEVVENARGVPVQLDDDAGHLGGPICDGSRFAQEFEFRTPALRERLVAAA